MPVSSKYLLVGTTMYLLTSLPAYGQNAFCGADKSMFFGNGVWRTFGQATRTKDYLAVVVRDELPPDESDNIEVLLSYNRIDLYLGDLLEAFIQEVSTDVTQFWRILAGLDIMPDSLRQSFLSIAMAIDEAALLGNQDLAAHVSSYKGKIVEGKKVVLVAHSQGNLFGNQLFGNLSSEEQMSFGIISVATPDDFVAGGGPHTTLTEDGVIAAVRPITGALDANVTNGFTQLEILESVLGHGMKEAYLPASSASRAKILNDLVAMLLQLEQPGGEDGIITVTLTWGAQPDVDLHAFEPNGTHVYYANPIGPSGFLDVDDVTSFGPEHYFVGCDTLETGNYRIGVNYFSGSAPETANVQIEAGPTARNFSIFLPTALGTAGNASPQPVATIIVSGSEQEGFEFVIQ